MWRLTLRCCLVVLLMVGHSSASAETILAVGTVYGASRPEGGVQVAPLILRFANGLWQSVPLSVKWDSGLDGVVFSSARTAWAFGGLGATSTLLRSQDGGTTWEDVTKILPDSLRSGRKLVALGFGNETTGWLIGLTEIGIGPYAAATRDGGSNWASIDGGRTSVGGLYAVGKRNSTAELLRFDGEGTAVEPIEDQAIQVERVGADTAFGGFAFATIGKQGWIAGASATAPDGLKDRPTIYTAPKGAAWLEQAIAFDGRALLRAIDFRDAEAGLAGGWTLPDRLQLQSLPLCLYTADGGMHWNAGKVLDGLDGMLVVSVLRTAGPSGWAVANAESAPGFALLQTADGGETWQRVTVPGDSASRVWSLAWSPEP